MLHAAAQHAGSSFGGWLALWLALQHPQRVAGLLLIAPAIDYTSRFWESLTPQQQQQAATEGAVELPSSYVDGGSIRLSHAFFSQAERFLMLGSRSCNKLSEQRPLACPVRILHGVQVRVHAGCWVCFSCSRLAADCCVRDVGAWPCPPQDDAVPVGVSHQLFELLPASDMNLTLVKDGDHRLSRPQDLRLMLSSLDELLARVDELCDYAS